MLFKLGDGVLVKLEDSSKGNARGIKCQVGSIKGKKNSVTGYLFLEGIGQR